MKVKLDDLPQITVQFVDRVLKPKVQGRGDLLAFGVGASKFLLPVVVQEKLTSLAPMLRAAGLVDNAGLLDVEKAEAAAKAGLETSGSIDIFGYRFDEADVAELVKIAKEYAHA